MGGREALGLRLNFLLFYFKITYFFLLLYLPSKTVTVVITVFLLSSEMLEMETDLKSSSSYLEIR